MPYGMIIIFVKKNRPTDRQTPVADTNKGVVEVQAIRLRANISILSSTSSTIKQVTYLSQFVEYSQ